MFIKVGGLKALLVILLVFIVAIVILLLIFQLFILLLPIILILLMVGYIFRKLNKFKKKEINEDYIDVKFKVKK